MAGKRVQSAEIEKRVTLVYDMLAIGSSRAKILEYVRNKTDWGVSRATVDNYIAKANTLFEENAEIHRARELGKALSRLNSLYQKTLQIQDFARCLAVQRELNQLLGLYEPTKVEININLEVVTRLWDTIAKTGDNPEVVLNDFNQYIMEKHALHD